MLCYVLNPPTHLTHYELLPETFFRPFFLFTIHCTQLTLGLKKQILYNGAAKINSFGLTCFIKYLLTLFLSQVILKVIRAKNR